MTNEKSMYLGDGVYIYFSGYDITLRTQRNAGEHYISLEKDMIDNLKLFADKCWNVNKQGDL